MHLVEVTIFSKLIYYCAVQEMSHDDEMMGTTTSVVETNKPLSHTKCDTSQHKSSICEQYEKDD